MPTSPFNPNAGQEQGNPAVVVTGSVPITDNKGQLTDVDDPMSPFADFWVNYRVVSRYEKDGHAYMMGITSPDGFDGQSAAFCQLAAPTLLLVVDWFASKFGEVPNLPDPQSQNANLILLDDHWSPSMLNVRPDSLTPHYAISGTYVYGHLKPNAQTVNDVLFPRPPWLEPSYPRNIPPSVLQKGIFD